MFVNRRNWYVRNICMDSNAEYIVAKTYPLSRYKHVPQLQVKRNVYKGFLLHILRNILCCAIILELSEIDNNKQVRTEKW